MRYFVHSDKSRRIFQDSVKHILPVRYDSQIASAVIQRVSVYMVYYLSFFSFQDYSRQRGRFSCLSISRKYSSVF
jgi:hypothetical protein